MSGRQMSQTANFPGRQLSLQPNVQERNVLGANCPERQLSGRQMSKAPNVGRQMSGRGLAGAICLPSIFIASHHSLHVITSRTLLWNYALRQHSALVMSTCLMLWGNATAFWWIPRMEKCLFDQRDIRLCGVGSD